MKQLHMPTATQCRIPCFIVIVTDGHARLSLLVTVASLIHQSVIIVVVKLVT